jgi:hypothetical protein
VRHETYERGVIVRCAQGDGVLTVVFYPTLVAGEDDVVMGTRLLGDALATVLGERWPDPSGGQVYHQTP